MILDLILWFMCELIEIFATVKIYKKITRGWDNSLFAPKKQRICRCFLHGCDSLGKIELLNKPFRKAIPCTFTITQIKQLYH